MSSILHMSGMSGMSYDSMTWLDIGRAPGHALGMSGMSDMSYDMSVGYVGFVGLCRCYVGVCRTRAQSGLG